mgnify:CR=1 FL=1
MSTNPQSGSRRAFMANIGKAGIFGTLAAAIPGRSLAAEIAEMAALPEAGHIFLSKPYLQAPQPDSMTIMWITNELCYSWVEYNKPGQLPQKAHESHFGLVNAYNRVNKVTLRNLKPGTEYEYRVFSRQILEFKPYKITYGETISSEPTRFRTPDPKALQVSWLVMNDIHDRPGSFADLMKINGDKPFDYVFLNGDMFDFQTGEKQLLDHLINPCGELFSTHKPFLFVRGNHETRGNFAREIGDYFANPYQPNYFAFSWGPVFHIALDTGEDKPDTEPVYGGIVDFDAYREEQAAWLEQQLKSPAFRKARYKVVSMHIPPLYSDDWHGTRHCNKLFVPLFNKYKIDLLVCGHTHRFALHDRKKGVNEFPIMIGGGPKAGIRTLIRIDAGPERLEASMFKDDGSRVGGFTIKG